MINHKNNALYPALMINENFGSRKLANPSKFKEIKDRRLELKKAKDKRQQPLKIVITVLVTSKYSFNAYQRCTISVKYSQEMVINDCANRGSPPNYIK